MTKLNRYLLAQVGFLGVLSLLFFTFTIVLSDLLINLSKLVPQGADLTSILWLSVLYVPQALSWSLAPSLLFSVSFVLGSLYAHNELIVVFGSGISLRAFTAPLFALGLVMSAMLFVWNDQGVIHAEAKRQALNRTLLGISSKNNTNVALIADRGRLLYSAGYYNDQSRTLTRVVLVWKDDQGNLTMRQDAEWADWSDAGWIFHKVKTYRVVPDGSVTYSFSDVWTDPKLVDPPQSFQKKNIDANELTFQQALDYVDTLKKGGLPYQEVETDALQRISFSFSPFVVVWISAALGGRFRKNILLMSLLSSLLVSATYIVLQMVFGLLAKNGFLLPWVGASSGIAVGALAGWILFLRAKT